MALLDHFHAPLSTRRHWHAFHNAWATYIAGELNRTLPAGYFAEPNVQFGIEIDVAAFDETALEGIQSSSPPSTWKPPAPTKTMPFEFSDEAVEVTIYGNEAGLTLAGAIELISTANKDRKLHRDAFTAKCETYLRRGIGLVVIDIVTSRNANLHEALLQRLGQPAETSTVKSPDLYAAAYRPLIKHDQTAQPMIDVWEEALAVGKPLPIMPLWLNSQLCLPVDLEASYSRTCREQRIAAVNSGSAMASADG